MDVGDAAAQSFAPDTAHFDFFQLQKLLGSPEKLFDDVAAVDETVESFEDQVLLEVPCFGLFVFFEVGGEFALEFNESFSKGGENLRCQNDFVQSFLNFNLSRIRIKLVKSADAAPPGKY